MKLQEIAEACSAAATAEVALAVLNAHPDPIVREIADRLDPMLRAYVKRELTEAGVPVDG